MKRTIIACLCLGLFACGGADALDVPEDAPAAGATAVEVAQSPELLPPPGPRADATKLPVCVPCEDGYELGDYYPPKSIFCRPAGDARLPNPCRGSIPIAWFAGGVVECAPVDTCELVRER
jgi:hypothetical protein